MTDDKQSDLDAKIAAANARLDAREDPPPPPLPPEEEVTVTTDLRLVIEEVRRNGVPAGSRWHVYGPVKGPDGAVEWREVDARGGITGLTATGCNLIMHSGNWPQPIFRGARGFLAGLQEAQRQQPTPAMRAAEAKAQGGGSA